MVYVLLCLGAAAALVMTVVLGVVVAVRMTGRRSGTEERPDPPKPLASGQELLAKKFALEQQMAGIAGGSTGMFVLLDLIKNCPAGGDRERYRESYRSRQKKLQGCVEEYRRILAQAAGLPAAERGRFVPDQELERYQMLAEEAI